MIGHIRGVILEKNPPQLLIDVNGIGYEVYAPMSTFYRLPDLKTEINLHTHFVVREDAQQLYGFYSQEERSLFRSLIKVNGVGPRLALTILSSIEPLQCVQCILNGDTTALVRIPGIGQKTAERLIVEMRDKLTNWQSLNMQDTLKVANKTSLPLNQHTQDAIAALIALGYKPQEANRVVNKVDDGSMSREEIIRRSLKEIL